MTTAMLQAIIFLLTSITNIVVYLLLIRFFLVLLRIRYYTPLSVLMQNGYHAMLKVVFKKHQHKNVVYLNNFRHENKKTNTVTAFIRYFLVHLFPTIKGVETLTITLIILIQSVKFYCVAALTGEATYWPGLLLLAGADTLNCTISICIFVIFIQVILSWLPSRQNEMVGMLNGLTKPLLLPFRKLLPKMKTIDLSPLCAILSLQALLILFAPILRYCQHMASY